MFLIWTDLKTVNTHFHACYQLSDSAVWMSLIDYLWSRLWGSRAATWCRLPDFMCHLAGKIQLYWKNVAYLVSHAAKGKTHVLPCCCCMWSDLYTHRCQKKLKQTTLLCFKQIRSVYIHTHECMCMPLCVCVCRLYFISFGRRNSCQLSYCHVSFQHFSPVLWNSLSLLFRLPRSYHQCWISVSCFQLEIIFIYRSISSWLNTFF